MRLLALFAALWLTTPASALAGGFTLDAATRSALADLFEKGGFGLRDEERGAFLLVGPAESPCFLWPFTATRRSSSFSGPIPAAAFAIAHTHPNGRPDPSSGDRILAESLGMPVLVVTARGVRAAVPGAAHPLILVEGKGWAREAATGTRCGGP